MFCSSLRKRPTWAHVVPVLANDKRVAWKGVHDQAVYDDGGADHGNQS